METPEKSKSESIQQQPSQIDILEVIRNLTEQVSELTNRFIELEAEVAALRTKNEQLKQITQQDNNTLSTADLALIISIAGIYNDHDPLTADYLKLKVANGWTKNIIIQYLARVALAKYIEDKEKETSAHNWGRYRLDDSFEIWHEKTRNASALKIVQMIKQLMNSATKQSKKTGPQR